MPDDEGYCWTCGRDWNDCRHDDVRDHDRSLSTYCRTSWDAPDHEWCDGIADDGSPCACAHCEHASVDSGSDD